MTKVLAVEDDRELAELLRFILLRAGFEIRVAHDVRSALQLLAEEPPDAILLDVNLGGSSGLDLLRAVRRRDDAAGQTVVVVLSGVAAEAEKVRALEMGADDYITKPFGHRELVARLGAQLRRARQRAPVGAGQLPPVLTVAPVAIDATTHRAMKDGQPLSLTGTEFRVLHYLMAHAGAVVTTRQLMRAVWGYADGSGTDAVRVTLYRLRRKLEDDPSRPTLLRTVPGVGVMFVGGGAHTTAA